jgi:hypothetical protein
MDVGFELPLAPPEMPSDLAWHFVECAALNANLSLAPGRRLVITDDFLNGTVADLPALSMAAIVAHDNQVARAAIIPLGFAAHRAGREDRARYERLFQLIEDTAFDLSVREAADALILSRFREAQIRDLVEELGGSIGPARLRYRAFLGIIRLLTEKRISESAFLDEFVGFTTAVAGKLDFGIYATCVDRLFVSDRIPFDVKALLLQEILWYPPLVRKELVSNLLSSAGAPAALVEMARGGLSGVMTRDQIKELFLFTTLKLVWQAQAALPERLAP